MFITLYPTPGAGLGSMVPHHHHHGIEHLRQHQQLAGLGATTIQTISDLAKAFPHCFDSRSILPSIDNSIKFAGTITTEGLSKWGGTASPASVRKQLDDQVATLNWWKSRLSTEPLTVYCPNSKQLRPPANAPAGTAAPAAVSSGDWQLIENAIMNPYQTLYGIEGARATVLAAGNELAGSLTLGFVNPLTGAFAIPGWVKTASILAGLAIVGGLFVRARGPKS